jgi:hypothetical protein
MLPVTDSTNNAYECTISYADPIPSGVNIASYVYKPALVGGVVAPGDTITFNFIYTGEASAVAMHKAVLIAGYKDAEEVQESSPFYNNANSIKLQLFPTLTIGSRAGTWGFTVSFSAKFPETSTTHFYFLPDPEVVVRPS